MLLTERLQKSTVAIHGGEDLNGVKVQFSDDAKWMYVSCGCHVNVYSYSSREVVYSLKHHTAEVTAILVNPANKMQVYTASMDGHLALWDSTDGSLLRVIDFGTPLYMFAIRPGLKDPAVFFVIEKWKNTKVEARKKEKAVLALVGMPSSVLTERKPAIAPSNQITEAQHYLRVKKANPNFVFSFEGTHVISSNGKVLHVYDLDTDNKYRYPGQWPITSLASHPSKNCIATGNQYGEIHLWHNFAQSDATVVKTTFHWHAHAVGDLCFTTDGTYLLSGGEESVLVLWQLDTHKKQFRPRLGSPITRLACSPGDKYFTVGLQSNVIQLVSGLDTAVEATIGGLRRSHDPAQSGVGLVFCPRSNSIVTNSTPGFLQFYQPQTNTVTQELNVTNLNYVSRPDDTPLSLTTVDQTTFSPDGVWITTVEGRDDRKTAPELRMKFWQFSSMSQSYILNTCVDPPHDQAVTCITYQPLRSPTNQRHGNQPSPSNQIPLLVSTSLDGRFKTWVLVDDDKRGVVSSWACQSVGYYHDLSCLGSAFCEDGSLLAVNFKKYITIWDPVTCELKKTFSDPFNNGDYKQIVFGHKTCSQYLIATSSNHLQVWDLLSCSVTWCVKTAVDLLVSDPYSSLTVAFVPSENGDTHLYMFSPSSHTPLAVHHSVCPGGVQGAVFLPPQDSGNSNKQSVLYFMDSKQVLYSLDEEGSKDKKDEGQRSIDTVMTSSSERAFRDIFGDTEQAKKGVTTQHSKPSTPSLSLFNAPPHVLPSMPSLCLPFLTSLLPSRPGSKGQIISEEHEVEREEEDINNGQSSEDEGQPEVGVVSHRSSDKMDIDEHVLTRNIEVKNYDWLVEHFRTL